MIVIFKDILLIHVHILSIMYTPLLYFVVNHMIYNILNVFKFINIITIISNFDTLIIFKYT